jgi:hypothetical protein
VPPAGPRFDAARRPALPVRDSELRAFVPAADAMRGGGGTVGKAVIESDARITACIDAMMVQALLVEGSLCWAGPMSQR